MHGSRHDQFIEERVTILTESERIEGTLFYASGVRLSDFLNSPNQQEAKFLRIKDPIVTCRRTGQQTEKGPFALVSRDRLVLVVTHEAREEQDARPSDSAFSMTRGLGPRHSL